MDRRLVGSRAEAVAAAALSARGYRILQRNFRSRAGELDLVCRDGDAFVFVEVKARRPSGWGVAAEALTAEKRARLARLAAGYLARIGRRGAVYRLELVAVALAPDGSVGEVRVVPLA